MKQLRENWTKHLRSLKRTTIWYNRFYILGLVAQKGLPILVIPLMVSVFGRDIYGDYVLLYTVVQVYATLSSLAIPQTIVPMWFHQDEPLRFVGVGVAILSGLAILFGLAMAGLSFTPIGKQALSFLPIPMALVWVVIFSLSYNLNTLAVGVVRVQDRQRHFFWATAIGGIVLLAGIWVAAATGAAALSALVAIQVLATLVAAILLFGKQPLAELAFNLSTVQRHCAPLLRFSLPLAGYSLLVLLSMGLDKWMARLWFSRDIFNTYVIDYQCAFALVFVPTAINLYNGPRISAFVASGEWDSLLQEERKAAQLTIFGCSVIAVLMYCYGWVSGLGLSPGYWVLVAGFMFEGLYILRTNRLMAQLRSFRMLFISATGIVVYIALLALAAVSASRILLYIAVPAYLGLTLLLVHLYTKVTHVSKTVDG